MNGYLTIWCIVEPHRHNRRRPYSHFIPICLKTLFCLFEGNLKKLPVSAATAATNAPTNAVTRMSKNELPFKGSIIAIFFESIPWFFISIHQARLPHKINNAKNPAKKDLTGD